jgi:hypothetical protein
VSLEASSRMRQTLRGPLRGRLRVRGDRAIANQKPARANSISNTLTLRRVRQRASKRRSPFEGRFAAARVRGDRAISNQKSARANSISNTLTLRRDPGH